MSGRFASVASVLIAAIAIAIPSFHSLQAQTSTQITNAQNAIEAKLSSGTIATSSTTALATAVAAAIKANTDSTLTPAYFAEAALLPYPYPSGSVRTEPGRDSAAILVTGSAITQLITTGTTATETFAKFRSDVTAITDSVVDVSKSTANELTLAGQAAVTQEAVGVISDAYYANKSTVGKVSLLESDELIAEKLVGDSYLEGLSSKGLTTILQQGMLGLNGVTGSSSSAAELAAQSFVQGMVLTGTVPNKAQGATFPTFAVAIVQPVSSNQFVDEHVAYELGLYDNNANQSSLVSMADALYSAYPTDQTEVTQGLGAAVPQGDNTEVARVTFANALVSGTIQDAQAILNGMIFVDPFYASQFTNGVFNRLNSISPSTLVADGTSIAYGIGNILGADGPELSQVANTYRYFIANGYLPVATTGTYAMDLIVGANKSTTNANRFTGAAAGAGGSYLKIGTNINTAIVTDLASIVDVLADGIVTYYHNQGTLNTTQTSLAASQIGSLAADVAALVGTEQFTDPSNSNESGYVSEFIAGTLADYIVALHLNNGSTASTSIQTETLNAIKADIEAISNNSTFDNDITAAVNAALNGDSNYTEITGPIAVQETTVTNL